MPWTPSNGGSTALIWKDLGVSDLNLIYSLHCRATEAVGRPDFIRPESRQFFEDLLAGGGHICGVFDAEGLLAYGVLQWDLPPKEDLRNLLGLAPDAPFAKIAGASVRPGHWGSGLQEALIAHRVTLARDLGYRHLYGTVAPGNARSWENLLCQGFVIRDLIEQYGVHLRFIVYRDSQAESYEPIPVEAWCDVADIGGQKRMIADGLIGTTFRRIDDGRRQIGWSVL